MPSLNRLAAVGVLAAVDRDVRQRLRLEQLEHGPPGRGVGRSDRPEVGRGPEGRVERADHRQGSELGAEHRGDLTDVAAQGCQGTIGLTAAATSTSKAVSGTADIIEVDSTVYMKLSESFFTSASLPASDFSDVSGKYIKLASNSDLASFAQLCNPSTLSTAFAKQDTGFVSAGTTTINGQTALAFKQPKNPSNGTVYVSQTATPQILRIAGPANEGSIDFTDYNAHATITAPPASEVVDGSKFGL